MSRTKTPTFLLELPLQVNSQQAKHLRAHFEAARCLYNALLGESMKRLKRMRDDPRWQQARNLPTTQKQERNRLFFQLRQEYGFSEYALHEYATGANTAWLADHLDANTAQKLATRAYQAANHVCLGKARKVRFKSKGRGLDSVEGKTNKQGIRFVLQEPQEGSQGWLVWGKERFAAMIDWNDPVAHHAMTHRIKFVRLLRRKASSPTASGADCEGYRYYAQLALEGLPYQKPKHQVGQEIVGLDVGPSTIAIVPKGGSARLLAFCSELKADQHKKRRLQRKLDRQRRANNPQNYDAKGRVKKGKKLWRDSQGYKAIRRRLAHQERKLAAHRKSLHGQLVHEVVAVGTTIVTEKISYKAWQKQYGKSVRDHAPGMFLEWLKRTVARTGGTLHEVPTGSTKLSQYCHGCGRYSKKPLKMRWHQCSCGIGPVQRDLYSAFLACHLDLRTLVPSIAQSDWESAETRLRAAIEDVYQRANAGEALPQSMGISRAGARLPRSLASSHQELRFRRGRVEAVVGFQEPPVRNARGVSGNRHLRSYGK
jgi:transposase